MDELAKQTLARMVSMKDNGRAQLVAFRVTAFSDRDKANAILREAIEPAFERLNKFVNESTKDAGSETTAKAYIPTWDWQIAIENAAIADKAESEKICDRLLKLSNDQVATSQLEETYVRLATLKFEKKEYDETVRVCKSGLSAVTQSSSLHRLMAYAYIQSDRVKDAKEAILQMKSNSEDQLRQLDGAAGLAMSTEEKNAVRQQIAADQWNLDLLDGRIAIAEQDFALATRLLRNAYRSTMPMTPESRIDAGQLLAYAFTQTNEWDSAAQVYSECSALKPNDRSIAAKAAQAWRRAGAVERASEQIGSMDDGSYQAALERAISISTQVSTEVDRRALVNAVKTARARLDSLPPEEQANLEPWRLELLELRSNSQVGKNQQEQEQDILGKLEGIAKKYADVAEVQSLAALDFAGFGRNQAAQEALTRLEDIAKKSGKAEDQGSFEFVRARVQLVLKDDVGALQILEDAALSIPEQALVFAKLAAQIEIRANRMEKAFSRIAAIPDRTLILKQWCY